MSNKDNSHREATADKSSQEATLDALLGSTSPKGLDKLVNDPPPLAKPGQVSVMLDSSTGPKDEGKDK